MDLILYIHCLLLRQLFVNEVSSFAIMSLGKRELVVLLYCFLDVLLLCSFFASSSWCRGLIYSVRLWHFLVIFSIILMGKIELVALL